VQRPTGRTGSRTSDSSVADGSSASSAGSGGDAGAAAGSGGGAGEAAGEAGTPAINSFDADTAVRLEDVDGARSRFAAEVSPNWRAGRGPHGGYIAAMILRALTAAVGDPARAPRSLTVHYTRAPEPGPVTITAVRERDGRSLSSLSGRMEQDGRLIALVLGAFSLPWAGPEIDEARPPAVEPPREPIWPGEEPPPWAPPIAGQTVLQRRFGGMPFTGQREAPMEIGGWLGHRERRPLDALSLAFFSDALLPAPFQRFSEPLAVPTIDLNVHFRAALPLGGGPPVELCLTHIRTRLIHEGFFEEDGLMWAPDGTLLAQSRQLAIVLHSPIG
jgi:acyl-coenzyme A thioesterase PaaI-like protein